MSALAVLVAMSCSAKADLMDNLIEDQRPRGAFGRPYSVQRCRSCGSGQCQVMGKFDEPTRQNRDLLFLALITITNLDMIILILITTTGMQRFSEPTCEPLGGVGSPCRMWQEPENKTLHFPDKILLCNNVHMQFCPCGPGLVCEEAQCRYRPQQMVPTIGETDNHDEIRQLEREERDSFGEDEDEMPITFEPNRSKYSWAVARYH